MRPALFLSVVAWSAVIACGSEATTKPISTDAPSALGIRIQGSGQRALAGEPLANRVGAQVVDSSSRVVAGRRRIRFSIAEGDGSISDTVVLSSESGFASVNWVLGKTSGEQQLTVRPPAAGGTLALHHRGDVDQALVIRAFAVPGSLEDLATTRALNVASEIVLTLLTDRFREGEGGTYSPMMTSDQPDWLPSYGVVLAGAQVRPSRIADFEAALDRILTELAARGPDPDQLARAKATLTARIDRSRTTNGYWLGVLGRNLDDPRRIDSVRTQIAAYRDMDAAAVQTAVARYLKPGAAGSYEVRVLPDDRTAAK